MSRRRTGSSKPLSLSVPGPPPPAGRRCPDRTGTKGAESRFAKTDRGRFTANGKAEAAPSEAPTEPAAKKARKGGSKKASE